MNRLPKIIVALFVGSLLIGLAIVFGGKSLFNLFKPTASAPVESVQESPVAKPLGDQAEAAGLTLAREVTSEVILDRKRATTDLSLLEGSQPEAIAFLSENLASQPAPVKIDMVVALGLLAPKNTEAIPPLVGALQDKDVRIEAMAGLGALGAAGASAVPALTEIYKNTQEPANVRSDAAKALTQITGEKVAAVAAPTKKKPAGKKSAKKKKR